MGNLNIVRDPTASRALLSALGACSLWGLLPVYWKSLQGISASEILAHRIVWAAVFVTGLTTAQRSWGQLAKCLAQPRTACITLASALILSVNWWIYVRAVNDGQVMQASLGYFINPLLLIALGRVVLAERLLARQWGAVAIAACGVLFLSVGQSGPPWYALGVGGSFALYGVLRKVSPLNSLQGLTAETLVMAPAALVYLAVAAHDHRLAFASASIWQQSLLLGCGVATAIPLLLFASAARRLKLATMGLFQYFNPTVQLALAVAWYGEPFTNVHKVAFGCIGAAIVVYVGPLRRAAVSASA